MDAATELLGNGRCKLRGRLSIFGSNCELTVNMMFNSKPKCPTIHEIMSRILIPTPPTTVSC